LENWNFVFKRVPNSHEYYFDIQAQGYKIVVTDSIVELDDFPTKMIDEGEVK